MIFENFLQNHPWQDENPANRIEAIREIGHAHELSELEAEAAAKIINDLALGDPELSVRVEAIAQLASHATLSPLTLDAEPQISAAANKQLLRVISGAVKSELDAPARVALVEALASTEELMSVILPCGCDDAGLAALARLRKEHSADQDTMLKIASDSHNHAVRFAAAEAISDLTLLEKLSNAVRHKDRAVFKLCRDQLNAWQKAQDDKLTAHAHAEEICTTLEALAEKPVNALAGAHYHYKLSQWQALGKLEETSLLTRYEKVSDALKSLLETHSKEQQAKALELKTFPRLADAVNGLEETLAALTAPLNAEQIDALSGQLEGLKALHAQASEGDSEQVTKSQDITTRGQAIIDCFHSFEVRANDVAKIQERLEPLTGKNTAALGAVKTDFYKLVTPSEWTPTLSASAAYELSQLTEKTLLQLLEKNQQYIAKLHKESLANIEALSAHIEKGEVNEAQRMWDKVQGAIKNVDEALKVALKEAVAPYKEKVSELIDWKNFAAQQKKNELIQKMQELISAETNAPEKAKRIKALQEQWKSLGHTLHNDILWVKFNEAARKAFEPCKEHFKERKAKLQTNFVERNNICETLEALVTQLNEGEVNIAELNKSESKALADWKLYAPVEQGKIKKLQQRFNAVLSDLRQFKRKTLQGNATQKLDLIEQAKKLDELEDISAALSEAKKLQSQWKTIGPSPYKDDRNHWNAFRAACDTLFNKRGSDADNRSKAKPGQTPSSNPAVVESNEVLKKIGALMHLSSEDLINTRKQFSELKDAFYATLSADLKHEKRILQEKFDRFSKQYESRLKAAPDRKSLQLIGQLKTKSAFCENLEEAVLSGKEADSDLDGLSDQWQDLGNLSDLMQEQSLEQRFHALTTGVDARIFKKLAKENADKAREICISAEIHAGIDSPDADKALRMQVQLLQLKNSFGARGNKSPQQQVNDLEMQLMCLGPLDKSARNACVTRLTKVKDKL